MHRLSIINNNKMLYWYDTDPKPTFCLARIPTHMAQKFLLLKIKCKSADNLFRCSYSKNQRKTEREWLKNSHGGWEEINAYERPWERGAGEIMGMGENTEMKRSIQVVPWAEHIWAASSGQRHSFGRTRSNVAVPLMSAGSQTQK